ncbi:MAG: hypothetical protein JOY85_23315 [Acidobacteriaceae bacterium]|nr:hypothetical protein [Acidobacteriaceae bacterium]
MTKKKETRLALLGQMGRLVKRNLTDVLHNTLEDGLLLALHFRGCCACFAKRESALQLGFKTAGVSSVPSF